MKDARSEMVKMITQPKINDPHRRRDRDGKLIMPWQLTQSVREQSRLGQYFAHLLG